MINDGSQPKKRNWAKVGCLGIIGVMAAIIALGAIGNALDPEGAERRAAEAKKLEAERSAAEASKAAAEREAAADKQRSGFHCLSSWDGSHRELVNALKKTLRDPDSFEHIETRITPVNDKGFHVLMMNYRARNGFGGMNIGKLAATVKNSDCSFEIVANVDQ